MVRKDREKRRIEEEEKDLFRDVEEEVRKFFGYTYSPIIYPSITRVEPVPHIHDVLFGVPVIDVASDKPFKGFYISHRVVFQGGEEWWEINSGVVELFAYFPSKVIEVDGVTVELPEEVIPFAHGKFVLPTAMEQINARVRERNQNFIVFANIVKTDTVVVKKRHIMYLEDVYAGNLPILLIDSSGVLSEKIDSRTLARNYAELLKLYTICYEQLNTVELERSRTMLYYQSARIEASRYKTLVEELIPRVITLEGIVKSLEYEVDRLVKINEILETYRSMDVATITTLREDLRKILETFRTYISKISKEIEELKKVPIEKPVPTEAKPEEKPEVVKVEQRTSSKLFSKLKNLLGKK